MCFCNKSRVLAAQGKGHCPLSGLVVCWGAKRCPGRRQALRVKSSGRTGSCVLAARNFSGAPSRRAVLRVRKDAEGLPKWSAAGRTVEVWRTASPMPQARWHRCRSSQEAFVGPTDRARTDRKQRAQWSKRPACEVTFAAWHSQNHPQKNYTPKRDLDRDVAFQTTTSKKGTPSV